MGAWWEVRNRYGGFERRLTRSQAQVLMCWDCLDVSPVGPQVGRKMKCRCGVQLLSSRWKKVPELTSVKLKDHIGGHGV